MKRFKKVILAFAFLACATFGFTACKDDEVTLLKTDLTNVTVYEGQELNLDGGFLHYQIDDDTKKISLASPDVSIFGFDKNTAGKQTVTVQYEGKTITMTVTVLPRVSVEGAQTVYFVGEEFNADKGTVKVVLNDGSTVSVPLNDSKISVEGFDSKAENGALPLTVTYTDGDFSYDCSYNVRIAKAEVSLKKPSKLAYKSHDTKLDLSGGYLSLTVDGKSEFVELKEDMVTGFNPAALTVEDLGTPVMQTITVNYKSQTFTFKVEVTYSYVSFVRYYANELATLDWSGEEAPEITEEQGENALAAIKAYMDLEEEDQALITDNEKKNILLPATVYGFEAWLEEAKAYQNTFVIQDNTVVLICESYETTKADSEKLQDTSAKIYTVGETLARTAKAFEKEEVLDTTVGEYLAAVYSASALENCKQALEYMVSLYDCLAEIPTEWTATDLEKYAEDFTAALDAIRFSRYKEYESRFVYSLVSKWREKDDYFDLMYTYYYNKADGTVEGNEAIEKMKDVALPGKLEDLYTSIVDAIWQTSYMNIQQQRVIDSTNFMALYTAAVEYMEEMSELEDGDMYKALYEELKFSGILQKDGNGIEVTFEELYDFVRTTSGGYIDRLHTMWESDLYERLWKPYLDIVTNKEEGYFESEQYGQDVAALFKAFVEARPSEQYSFLDSLNTFYRYTQESPILALETKDGVAYSTFSMIVANYFNDTLGEEMYPMYQKLVAALEHYVLCFKYEGSYEYFEDNMYDLKAEYDALEDEQKATFDAALGYAYEKYLGYFNAEFVELDETWSAKFEELATAYKDTYDAYVLITGGGEENAVKVSAYTLFFSSYKKAQSLANYIVTEAPEAVKNVYYYQSYTIEEDWIKYSMDYWDLAFRSIYAEFMMGIRLSTTSGDSVILWDVYNQENYNLDEFLIGAYELLRGFRNQSNGGFDDLTLEEVLAIMESYRNLTVSQKIIFSYFDSASSYYHMALKAYFENKLTSSAGEVAMTQIWEAEKAYFSYVNHVESLEEDEEEDTKYQEEFKKAVETLKQKYTAISEETERAEFDALLKTVYDYYVGEYDKLNEAGDSQE